jgi:anti-sigma-K factor RskA/putative zinc finger protein
MSEPRSYGGLTCDEVRELAGSFVLGALDGTQEAAVREHLASCPEAHEEIAELGGVLPVLAESVPMVEPPAGLRDRIMAAAAADLEERDRGSAVSAPAPAPADATAPADAMAPVAFPGPTERRAGRRGGASTATWLLRIAAVVAIAVLGISNLLLRAQLSQSQSFEQAVQAVLDVSAKPGSLTAVLTASGGSGTGLAAIDSTGAVTMAMQDLAPTAGNQVYEAWVIGGDGVPVPIGSFQVGNGGTASMTASGVNASSGAVLALTLEAGPGAKTPTLPIISKGVATPAA